MSTLLDTYTIPFHSWSDGNIQYKGAKVSLKAYYTEEKAFIDAEVYCDAYITSKVGDDVEYTISSGVVQGIVTGDYSGSVSSKTKVLSWKNKRSDSLYNIKRIAKIERTNFPQTITITLDGTTTSGESGSPVICEFTIPPKDSVVKGDSVYGFKSDKSLAEILTNAGKFVTVQGTTNISLGQVKAVDVTLAQCQEWFGTTDTSKIHVIATDMYRTCQVISGQQIKSWSNSYYRNTDEGYDNLEYTIPYIDFYDLDDYPWPEDRIAVIFLYNHNQIDIHEQVTYRIFAFVDD